MIEKLDVLLTLIVVAASVFSSVVTILVSYAVFKATIVLKLNSLRKEFDSFVDSTQIKVKEMEKETNRIALNQQSKITSISSMEQKFESLEEKFDQFRGDHIREISGMADTLQANTKAIHELTGTLNVIKDFIKK